MEQHEIYLLMAMLGVIAGSVTHMAVTLVSVAAHLEDILHELRKKSRP